VHLNKGNSYTNKYGVFDLDSLLLWISKNPREFKYKPLKNYIGYIYKSTWCDSEKLARNIDILKYDQSHQERVFNADLSSPILVLKETGEIIDGVHRIFKAVIERVDYIRVNTISLSELMCFRFAEF